MEQVLELKFISETGKNLTISLDSPKEDLSDQMVKDGMEEMIRHNALSTSNDEAIVQVNSAKIITKTVKDFNLE